MEDRPPGRCLYRGGVSQFVRRYIFAFIYLLLVLSCSPTAHAQIVLDDGFTDTSQVDMTRTTALVDTANHWVQLPIQSLASAIDAMDSGYGYAVASKSGVTLYEKDDATGKIAPNTLYSCPWATDATGVSLRQDNLNMWVISPSSIAYYKFSGAGMSNDPALKTAGLVNVYSVAAFKKRDSALLLQADGSNNAVITRYDAGVSLNPSLVFKPNISNPVSISMVNDSPDFRLNTKDTSYYFVYDDATGNYVEDPSKKITGLANLVSARSDDEGNSILTSSDLGYYINLDSGGASRVDVFSPGAVSNPVSVALKRGSYEQVFLDSSGNVQWWAYNDGQMVRDSSLEVSGLNLNKGFARPRDYYSKAQSTAAQYDAAYLTVSEDKPPGTSISYYVSSDGGNTFTPITPNTWTAVPRGNNFVVKATLDTSDTSVTPKILHVTLQADEDFQLHGSVNPYPAERGANVTITAIATSLTAGSRVTLDQASCVCPMATKLDGSQALPPGQNETQVPMTYDSANIDYTYTFTVPEITVHGYWPDDGVYQVRITGIKNGTSKSITIPMEIHGNILRRLVIRTITW